MIGNIVSEIITATKFDFKREAFMSEAAGERIDHSTVTQDDIDRASRSIKAMSHPLRLKILCILGDSEFSVQDIVDTGHVSK